jgi:thymidylate kinase
MNKLIVIESGDRLGKGTLIGGLCKYFDYKNIAIRHCDKPPKEIPINHFVTDVLDFQFECFRVEMNFILNIQTLSKQFQYHENKIIYDRFYLGEFVYGQMFRNYDANLIKERILKLENQYLKNISKYSDIYLITLTADPEFFHSREDGNSFSQKLEQKTKELELFKEAHQFSSIPNKHLIKVDNSDNDDGLFVFRTKEDILNEVLNFLKEI